MNHSIQKLSGFVRGAASVLVLAILAGTLPAAASTPEEQSLVEGAKLCTRYLPRHERQYGIPEHLLAAIASSESGRFHRGLGLNLPWPWTLNVNGRGYFFDTKEEAVAAVNKFRSAGYQSIDVGCMQVNLRHHPKAFASVEQALDPAYNVGYAAGFLKRNFLEEGTWRKATAAYHSRTDSFGLPYSDRVFNAWGKIVTKVADARAGRLVLNTVASNSDKASRGTSMARSPKVVRPSYRSLRLRSITVASNDKKALSREKGVLVVRPRKSEASEDIVFHSTPPAPVAESKAVRVVALKPSEAAKPDTAIQRSTPAVVADDSASALSAKPIKVVSLKPSSKSVGAAGSPSADSVANRGQFEPKPRATPAAVLDKGTPQVTDKNTKMFVFDY